MTRRKLREFITLVPGINQSRVENQLIDSDVQYYDQSAFESDLNFESYVKEEGIADELTNRYYLCAGDIIVSNIKQVAAIVGRENAGKILTINFAKVEFFNTDLDKGYFIFLFNSYKDLQRQKERETQGTGIIKKIPLRSLEELQIPYITMSQQKLIGNAYVEMLEIQNKLKKYTQLSEVLTCSILQRTIEEGGEYE